MLVIAERAFIPSDFPFPSYPTLDTGVLAASQPGSQAVHAYDIPASTALFWLPYPNTNGGAAQTPEPS
jgi:hypothetical protein